MARRQAEFKRDTQRLETDYGGKHEGGKQGKYITSTMAVYLLLFRLERKKKHCSWVKEKSLSVCRKRNIKEYFSISVAFSKELA